MELNLEHHSEGQESARIKKSKLKSTRGGVEENKSQDH